MSYQPRHGREHATVELPQELVTEIRSAADRVMAGWIKEQGAYEQFLCEIAVTRVEEKD